MFFFFLQEINRSNRRIIKQTFVSDVLEITDPQNLKTHPLAAKTSISDPTSPLNHMPNKPATTVDPETDDWEALFDENGDCLDPKFVEELTAAVGKVTIEKPKSDYKVSAAIISIYSFNYNSFSL